MADPYQEVREINKYIDNLTIKALGVENDSIDILRRIQSGDENLRVISKDAHLDLHDVRELLRETEAELKQAAVRLERLIQQFKGVVKKEELVKFEMRIDELPFEQFVTKKELRKRV